MMLPFHQSQATFAGKSPAETNMSGLLGESLMERIQAVGRLLTSMARYSNNCAKGSS
jgi:hypothetical protein